MWDKVKDLFSQTFIQLLAIGVIAVVTWLFARLASVPAYLIIVAIVFVLACTFWGINQIDIFRERRNKGFATLSNERIEATLRRWLDKEKYKIQSDSKESMHFQFKAEDNARRVLFVARPKNLDNFIVIGGSWLIPPEYQLKFDGMSETSRTAMLEELRIEMLRFKVDYAGLQHPLRRVGVEVRVPCDETCTQSLFLQQINTAKYAYILMTTIMEKALRAAG